MTDFYFCQNHPRGHEPDGFCVRHLNFESWVGRKLAIRIIAFMLCQLIEVDCPSSNMLTNQITDCTTDPNTHPIDEVKN